MQSSWRACCIVLFEPVAKTLRDLGRRYCAGFKTFLLGRVGLGSFERQPDRLKSFGIIRVAREEMPVQVRHLVAEKFVVEFVWSEALLDSLGEEAHLFKMLDPVRSQPREFGRM